MHNQVIETQSWIMNLYMFKVTGRRRATNAEVREMKRLGREYNEDPEKFEQSVRSVIDEFDNKYTQIILKI